MEFIWENEELIQEFSISQQQPRFRAPAQYPIYTDELGMKKDKKDICLPVGWFWMTDWSIDMTEFHSVPGSELTEKSGWMYGKSFESIDKEWILTANDGSFRSSLASSRVRRRRWVRIRKKRTDFQTPLYNSGSLVNSFDILPKEDKSNLTLEQAEFELSEINLIIEKLLEESSCETDHELKRKKGLMIQKHLDEAEAFQARIDAIQQKSADEIDNRTSHPKSAPFNFGTSPRESGINWQSDEEAPACVKCNKTFGFFLRKVTEIMIYSITAEDVDIYFVTSAVPEKLQLLLRCKNFPEFVIHASLF